MQWARGLVFPAIGLVCVGALISYLLDQGNVLGNWLLAAVLLGHGWIHVMYLLPARVQQSAMATGPDWPFVLDRSWVLSPAGVGSSAQHALGAALVALTIVAFGLAGLASVPVIAPTSLWAPAVLVGSLGSLALMAAFFRPMVLLGLIVDVVLLWAVLFTTWRPA